jgi:hypothetical protein
MAKTSNGKNRHETISTDLKKSTKAVADAAQQLELALVGRRGSLGVSSRAFPSLLLLDAETAIGARRRVARYTGLEVPSRQSTQLPRHSRLTQQPLSAIAAWNPRVAPLRGFCNRA